MFVSVLMTYPATIAIIAETFGQYLIEGLKQVYEIDDEWAPLAQKLFGFSLLMLVTWMNFFSLNKFAARFQIIATAAKLISCFLIIATGLYYYYVKGWRYNLRDPMKGSNYKIGDLILGFYGGLWAYSGWDVLNYSTGEIAKPRRYMFAASRQGHLPACFSCVNADTESPRVAILAQSMLAMAISFVGDLDALIGYVMFGFWAQRIFTLVALLIIRHNRIPVHPEAVRVPLWW
ncbi:hypothetical protein NECAME_01435 [Necator americanus]|uniref:Amino acid permease/ SLC12A domain-containing protein n=1 Tax=Necator americanus TaxID=51031 RepID=W2TV69_NECAM|nr:hypothetical protein NECAME_01435 [Necator americanus]ETN85544.1 hypothetical protein NECAME_01435 [Necator americanus]